MQWITNAVRNWLLRRAMESAKIAVARMINDLLQGKGTLEWARGEGRKFGVEVERLSPAVTDPAIAAFFEGAAEGVKGAHQPK